ncbi:MAG: class I SAM-dependent methyltransferase [Gammaproteobacteria bacterium AqS3]|nr:class I SAM-dependent methyltransferase [Gammaproteobacteria bacterium AqS3]
MSDANLPPSWSNVGRHGVFPQPDCDETARFDFLTQLNAWMASELTPQLARCYTDQALPEFQKNRGRAPEHRNEVRDAMQTQLPYRLWCALRRCSMEMRQQAGRALVLRQVNDLNRSAQSISSAAPEGLRLDADLPLPRYVEAVDTHCMPGSYHTALGEGDVSAGANYDCGIFVTTGGALGRYSDGGGCAIVEWLEREHPEFSPRRILDLGCTVGHNIVPLAQHFRDAEVIAVDVSAPVLRYAHARAQSLGVDNIRFVQMNAERLDFADGCFDLITTSMFLHELSMKALPRILAETHRVAADGGLIVHLEQPRYTDAMPLFEQFMRDWDTLNNNEPFWSRMHELDIEQMMVDVGFPASGIFQMQVAASVDEELFPATRHDAAGEDYGRTPAWHAYGAWKGARAAAVAA